MPNRRRSRTSRRLAQTNSLAHNNSPARINKIPGIGDGNTITPTAIRMEPITNATIRRICFTLLGSKALNRLLLLRVSLTLRRLGNNGVSTQRLYCKMERVDKFFNKASTLLYLKCIQIE